MRSQLRQAFEFLVVPERLVDYQSEIQLCFSEDGPEYSCVQRLGT